MSITPPYRRASKWLKLLDYLNENDGDFSVCGKRGYAMDDDVIQQITGSIQQSRPYNIKFTNRDYSIEGRANAARFNVYPLHKGRIKVFIEQ